MSDSWSCVSNKTQHTVYFLNLTSFQGAHNEDYYTDRRDCFQRSLFLTHAIQSKSCVCVCVMDSNSFNAAQSGRGKQSIHHISPRCQNHFRHILKHPVSSAPSPPSFSPQLHLSLFLCLFLFPDSALLSLPPPPSLPRSQSLPPPVFPWAQRRW